MTQAIILDRNTNNDLWLKIILAITQVKNIWPIISLEDKNIHKIYFNKTSKLSHWQALKSIIYVFIYKKEPNQKLAKFEAQVLNKTLVKYYECIIYWAFI